jgi:hypothetical protein
MADNEDSMINKIASWPKWATEDSINKLNANMSVANQQIVSLLSQLNRKRGGTTTTTVKGSTIDQSKPIISEFQRGFRTLESRLNVTNILLDQIRKNGLKNGSSSAGPSIPGSNSKNSAKETNVEETDLEEKEKRYRKKIDAANKSILSARSLNEQNAARKELRELLRNRPKDLKVENVGQGLGLNSGLKNIAGKMLNQPGGITWKNTANAFTTGIGSMLPTVGKFGGAITAVSGILGALIPVGEQLFKIWSEGAKQSGEAFNKGLDGLATSVLSFAINAKTAGLSVEQFGKMLAKSNGGLNQMDSRYEDAGKTFASSTKDYLTQMRQFNYFGLNIEQMGDAITRSSDLVGRMGYKDKKAKEMAIAMAIEDAETLRNLSQQTGTSITELGKKFDSLYNDRLFQTTQRKLIERGQLDAAKELSNAAKTLSSLNNPTADKIRKDMQRAALMGVDPSMIEGPTRDAIMQIPEIMEAIQRTKNMPVKEQNAELARVADKLLNDQGRMSIMGLGGLSSGIELQDMLMDMAANKKEAAKGGKPEGPGADAFAADIELKMALQKAEGELLKAIDPLMPAFTELARVVSKAITAFTELDPVVKKVILGLAGLAAALLVFGAAGKLGSGVGRLLGRGAAPAAAAGSGARARYPAGTVIDGKKVGGRFIPEGAGAAAAEGAAEGAAAKNPIKSVWDKLFNSGKYAPVDMAKSAITGAAEGAAEGAASSGLKGIAKKFLKMPGGGAIGALLDTAINEVTDVDDMKTLRSGILEKYKKGEIPKAEAVKAIKDLDDKIAESRGGAAARGAVAGTGAAIGGGIAGAGTMGLGTLAGGAAGGGIANWLFGDTASAVGGWLSKQLFGGSESDITKELDTVRPLAGAGGPNAQPGAINTPSSVTSPTAPNAATTSAQSSTTANAQQSVIDKSQQLVDLQRQANQLLASILNVQSQMQADTRKSTDSLEMLNNKM